MVKAPVPPLALRLNRVAIPVTNLGYGRRAVIWVQGCAIACPGCIARHTWNRKGGESIMVSDLSDLIMLSEEQHGPLDGLTISGGEPTDQADGLRALLSHLRAAQWLGPSRDALLYSGRGWGDVVAMGLGDAVLLDAVIAGPFVENLPRAPLMGSSNQTVVPLTTLGANRYNPAGLTKQPMQGVLDGELLLLSGIGDRESTNVFEKLLNTMGIGIR